MVNQERTEENNSRVYISNDRTLVTIRLTGENSYSEYKQAARNRIFANYCDRAELLPATVTPDGYVCRLRSRATLKEIVCGDEVLDVRGLSALASCLKELIVAAKEYGVDPRDFVYDYNGVEVRRIDADYRFVYMPGLRFAEGRTTVSELLKIYFLNTETEDLSQSDYEAIRNYVTMVRTEESPDDILEDLDRITGKIDELFTDTSFTQKLKSIIGFGKVRQNADEAPAPVIYVLKGLGGLEGLSLERCVRPSKRLEIRIGRDEEWADIPVPDMFASRRHAELTISGNGQMTVANLSLNGIVVDGEKTKDCISQTVKGTEVVINITDSCGIVLSAA